ncbi:hypothetical protein IFM89_021110 [Coptis chinensis]|uniref:Bidirectional sugar transporter SWEET n=1 Tax=Coptis chinensis TaxID=261450 RepID=A0A835LSB9_9MAGN|nr:hypothetical protein IFM89_021110 [Coptis chinensis]
MSIFANHHPLALVFGILGNIFSFMGYLAPLPTFYRVYKKKSTEDFHSIPYVVALFSAMIWIYYACLKSNAYLLITVNTIGCVIETMYIVMFMVYAPRKARILTAKLLLLLNLGAFSLIISLTMFLVKGDHRVTIVGWVSVVIATSVFAAPLSILRLVIRTKSVEFMPYYLSFFLTLSAIMWFSYGLLLKDYFVAVPNVLGITFGILQMVLYAIYRNAKKVIKEKLPERIFDIVKMNSIEKSEVHPIDHPVDGETKLAEEHINEESDKNERSMDCQNDVQMIQCQV